jgi:hypothetical protein
MPLSGLTGSQKPREAPMFQPSSMCMPGTRVSLQQTSTSQAPQPSARAMQRWQSRDKAGDSSRPR